MFLLDAHVDSVTRILRLRDEPQWELDGDIGQINLKKLEAFNAPVIFFAIFLDREEMTGLFSNFLKFYGFLEDQVRKNADKAAMALSYADIQRNMRDGKLSAVPVIEDGSILEGKMENLYKAAEMGIRYITLTWNYANEIGEPSKIDGKGLTAFGRDAVREMRNLGILTDVSHLSEPGFWDVYNLTDGPFIASHSNCKALCSHHRNLTDGQLKAIGEKGGCVGLNVNPPFLVNKPENGSDLIAGIDDVCRHADHMLKLAGENNVGLGTDFDGISRVPEGLEDASKLTSLHGMFIKRYGSELTRKIFFGNFMRVLEEMA
ncbi:MAG: dipeptidase [Defluviitaleaceae bacterium]|nr:dipeptidase [Defluviitaleaceae bacterium]MCL2836849.1 dipeptidase [Defluviitaleaceae bacterium]